MSALTMSVEQFSLSAAGGRSYYYERDYDLTINTKKAMENGYGDQAALVMVELGIDGYDAHRVRLDFSSRDTEPDEYGYSPCGDDEVRALTDAIETLTAIRDRLAGVLHT